VVCPVDKINGQFGLVCINQYQEWLLDEVESSLFQEILVGEHGESSDRILQRIIDETVKLKVADPNIFDEQDENGVYTGRPSKHSSLYLMPKLHKEKVVGKRAVAGGSYVATTCISQVLSRLLRACIPMCDLMTQELWFTFTGLVVPKSSIAATTDDVLAHVELLNGLVARQVIKKGEELSSLDFAALYPSVMHSDLLEKLRRVLQLSFAYALGTNNSSSVTAATNVYLKVEPYPSKEPAAFVFVKGTDDGQSLYLEVDDVYQLLEFLINNSYVTAGAGKRIFKYLRGIPTGTNAAPEITNLYLFIYEFLFLQLHLPNWGKLPEDLKTFMISWKRYIDDCLHSKIGDTSKYLYQPSGMYPRSLTDPKTGQVIDMPLALTGEKGPRVKYLDVELILDVETGRITYKLHDKREYLVANGIRFSDLRNFPHIDSNLADMCKYGVMTSQLHRYARRFTKASDFQKEVLKLTNKMIQNGYLKNKLVQKIVSFRGWRPTLGRWPVVLRRILTALKRIRPG